MQRFLFAFGLITFAFTSQAYAAPEMVALLDSSSVGWRVVRYADQGRCAVQSPRINGTTMIINVKKENPGGLFFTFTNPEETMWLTDKGDPNGRIGVYREPFDYRSVYLFSLKDTRVAVWSNFYDRDGMAVYYQQVNENLFTTVVTDKFGGIDRNTNKPIDFLDILTSDEYRFFSDDWSLEFSNSDDPSVRGNIEYAVAINMMPDLSPFLNCLN